MTSEVIHLTWNEFQKSTIKTFKHLEGNDDFTDVTLACGDGQQLRAHKVILSSSSSLFRNILVRNHHQNPLIYLKGTNIDDLKGIIKFVYSGEVQVENEQLSNFLKTANDLEIQGLTIAVPTEKLDGNEFKQQNELTNRKDFHDMNEIKIETETNLSEESSIAEIRNVHNNTGKIMDNVHSIDEGDKDLGDYDNDEDKLNPLTLSELQCDQCHFNASSGRHLVKHRKEKHPEATTFNCIQCDKQFTNKYNLKVHQLAHTGIKYPCSQCEYQAKFKSNLARHIQNIHKIDH